MALAGQAVDCSLIPSRCVLSATAQVVPGCNYCVVTPLVEAVATDGVAGMTTYRLSAQLNEVMTNVYALYGSAETPLSAPAAFQVAAPAGVDVGGISPALFTSTPEAEYDSWLTIGSTDGSVSLSTAGISFDTWDASTPLAATDGLVFVAPDTGPAGTVVVGQMMMPAVRIDGIQRRLGRFDSSNTCARYQDIPMPPGKVGTQASRFACGVCSAIPVNSW